MIQDLRHAIRLLLRSKGWTLVVVLSLALGIGANVAIFGAINGLLLRTLPGVDRPEALVRFQSAGDNEMISDVNEYGFSEKDGGQQVGSTFSYSTFQQLRSANAALEGLFACAPEAQLNVVMNGRGEVATGLVTSGNYFQTLGVRASIGRTLVPDDDRDGAPPVAVLSDGYWKRRFGGDANVVGTVLRVNTVPVIVVGVTPPAFVGVQQVLTEASDITMPLALDRQFNRDAGLDASRLDRPAWAWLQVMGRLKPGVTPTQAQGNLDGVYQQAARDGWQSYLGSLPDQSRAAPQNQDRTNVPRLRVSPGSRGIYDVNADTYRSITLLGIVVALVLAIVCANVANLLLSRATARQREISVRLSLGATRGRLIRQLLTESVLLSSIGAALGILVAYWGRQLLPGNLAIASPLDWRVIGFVGGLALATGIVFGIAPAWRSSGMSVGAALKDGRGAAGGQRSLLGKSLVVAQVAISLVLLVGAGLFLRTIDKLRHVDVGFDARNLLLLSVSPGLNHYDQTRIATLYGALLDSLPQVPGARAATLSVPALLSGRMFSGNMVIQGRPAPGRNGLGRISSMTVAPNFFETMGIPVVAGRGFTTRDNLRAPRVVVINEAAARKYFPHENPLGQRLGSGQEIIGVVRDAKYNSVRDEAPPTNYGSYLQSTRLDVTTTFELRTAGDPATVAAAAREAIRQIDPNLPITTVATQTDQIERRFAQEKVFAQAYTLFGALTVLVASIGLFGLMSYSVARRTNEIGIRMALGAERGHVVGMVMRESLLLIAGGIVIGAAVALAAGRFVAGLLFDLAPNDPATIAGAATIMIAISALAGYLPARAAARVEPMVALRDL